MSTLTRSIDCPTKGLNALLLFLPLAVVLEITGGNPTLIFVSAALAILLLAGIMRQATEQLAVRAGRTVGGLSVYLILGSTGFFYAVA